MKKDTLIIYSGGMDSTTLLYEFQKGIALAVSFNYGSKHNEREIFYAKKNCKKLQIPHKIIPLDFIKDYFKSDLLKSGGDIPEGHYAHESMKATVVPFRNGIMLSIAAGLAESNNLNRLIMAAHFGDHAIYPDCRKDFVLPMTEAIKNGTYLNVELSAPYVNITKRGVASRGRELKVDYSQTWSCYKGNRYHCGKCGTCVERKEALLGFDRTIYKSSHL